MGNYHVARPTIYRGIQMRSRTEAHAAAAFDRAETTWIHEPVCYANAHGQYLPDFVLADKVVVCNSLTSYWSGQSFWEIKCEHKEAESAPPRMSVIWDGSIRAPLIAWVPNTRRAWAALPDTRNLNDAPQGRMFEADVMRCDAHGVVVQGSWLSQDVLGCTPCELDEIMQHCRDTPPILSDSIIDICDRNARFWNEIRSSDQDRWFRKIGSP